MEAKGSATLPLTNARDRRPVLLWGNLVECGQPVLRRNRR